jgi:hypothetical protein
MSATPTEHEHDHDDAVPVVHDQAAEVAHAWKDLYRDIKIFACFLTIILLTVLSFNINLGSPWNLVVAFIFGGARLLVIAYFFICLVGSFSFLVRTVIFTAIFFAGMVYLSMWGSMLPHVGDPIELPKTHATPNRP